MFGSLEGMSKVVVVLDSGLSSSLGSPEELGIPKRGAEENSSDKFGLELLVPLLMGQQ